MSESTNKPLLFSISAFALQVEGARMLNKRTLSIWDDYIRNGNHESLETMKYQTEYRIDPAADFYHKYLTDIKIMKDLGVNSFIYALDWSRIMPLANGDVNREGIEFYQTLFSKFNVEGIRPIPIFFQWDTPMWLEKLGGWNSPEILNYFRVYCSALYEYLGEYCDFWIVNSDCSELVYEGYLGDKIPPFKSNLSAFANAVHHLNMSAAIAKDEFLKYKRRNLNNNGQIGVISNWVPALVFPDNNEHEQELKTQYNHWYKNLFLDPIFKGSYPGAFLKWITDHDLEIEIKDSDMKYLQTYPLDFLGWKYNHINHISDIALEEDQHLWEHPSEVHISDDFQIVYPKSGIRYNDFNELLDPSYLLNGALELIQEYQKPLYIINPGYGAFENNPSQEVLDYGRIDYLVKYQEQLNLLLAQSSNNIIGYNISLYCDGFTYKNAYDNRQGLVRVDFLSKTKKRLPKLSYIWVKNMIASKGQLVKYDKKELEKSLKLLLKSKTLLK